MKKVVVVGSATVDVIVKSSALRAMKSHEVTGGVALCEVYGGKIVAEELKMISGGGATNVAVGLKRLGVWVRPVGVIGQDEMGGLIKKELKTEGIESVWLQESTGETALSVVLVAVDGGRSILTHRDKEMVLSEKLIDWKAMESADWMQITGSLGGMELLENIVYWSKSRGMEVGLNPGKSELVEKDKLLKLLPKIDFLSLNRMEAVQFWGERYEEVEEKILAKKFLEAGVKMVAITDGKRGAGLAVGDKWWKSPAFDEKSVDDTGAGDAFVTGVVYGVLDGRTPAEMLKMGLANGGNVVKYLGAKMGLMDLPEMEKWLAKKLVMVEEKL